MPILLMFLLLAAPAPPAPTGSNTPAVPSPIAVAPFRNLANDASLGWLEQGAAETITADLKRMGGLAVVERAQLQQALTQVAAQHAGEVEGAVAAGRIVGARSMVLGSFQRVGKQLRLVGRMVTIETGEVTAAATATGAVDDVFALQDSVVRTLLGRPPPPRRAKKVPLPAYERLGEALQLPDDSARAARLTEALVVDPDFIYASDALSSLEARLRASSAVASTALDARATALLAIVEDRSAPVDRRAAAARALLELLTSAQRFRALVGVADRIVKANLPADVVDDASERAASARVLALLRLMRTDAGLQAAERYLAAFPAGQGRAAVEALVREAIDDRRTLPKRVQEFDDELSDVRVILEAGHVDASEARSLAFKPCIAAKWSRLPRDMIVRCRRFLADHGTASDDDGRGNIVSARAWIAWGHALQGDFARAQAQAAALERDLPGSLDDSGLRSVMVRWGTD